MRNNVRAFVLAIAVMLGVFLPTELSVDYLSYKNLNPSAPIDTTQIVDMRGCEKCVGW